MDITRGTAADDEGELADHPGLTGDMANTQADLLPVAEFGDHKEPGAFRTIGEVAKALGIRQHVLRYWEGQFPMLSPVKRSGNRRYYRPEDVALIERIDRLVHRDGYTLRGARLALEPAPKKAKPAPVPQAPHAVETATAATPPWLEELQAIRATLADALAG